jgi:hypothetical protein
VGFFILIIGGENMELTIYKNAPQLLKENYDFLERHSFDANIMWKIANSEMTTEDGFFGAAVKWEDGCYIAVQTKPFPMVNYAEGEGINEMVERLVSYLIEKNNIPERINGDPKTVQVFANVANEKGYDFTESRYLYLRKCEKVNDIEICNVQYQSPITIDFDFSDWLYGFAKDCDLLHEMKDPAGAAKSLVESGRLTCVLIDGKPVSIAGKNRGIPGGRSVGEVYTPPHLRGKGYSLACMKYITQDILNEGYDFVFLYADKYNPISNHVYEKIVYKKVGELMEQKRT